MFGSLEDVRLIKLLKIKWNRQSIGSGKLTLLPLSLRRKNDFSVSIEEDSAFKL